MAIPGKKNWKKNPLVWVGVAVVVIFAVVKLKLVDKIKGLFGKKDDDIPAA